MAEEARLESVCAPKAYREFESRSLRKVTRYKSARFKRVTFVLSLDKQLKKSPTMPKVLLLC